MYLTKKCSCCQVQYKSELWLEFRNVIPKILKHFFRSKKMRIFYFSKWLKPLTSFKSFKSYVKKIWNVKNIQTFLDQNIRKLIIVQPRPLVLSGQAMPGNDEIWQINCVFFPCCMFPNKKYCKKLQILKKNQCFGASVNISGLFLRLTDVLFLKWKLWQTIQVISRRNLTEQLRVSSIVHVSHQKT